MSHQSLNPETSNLHQVLSDAVDGGIAAVKERLCRNGCEWAAEDLARAVAAAVARFKLYGLGERYHAGCCRSARQK